MQTLRAKPALMILFVLLALALLSGAAYAIGRSLGYIPGVGIVEQGTPIRVLAEPVSVTRDGITVTVTSATLAADKTVITYTIENVPWDAISHREDEPGCYGQANIRLPNGSLLVPESGSGGMDASGRWETRLVYSAVPPQFNDGEFLLDCIRETLPGLAPENWKLALHFIPAPPDLTVMPVVEIPIPTPAPSASGIPVQTGGLVLEKVIETEAGYILIGKFHADTLPGGAQALGFSQWPRVIDAAGQELPYRTANDVDVVSTTMGEFPWTLEIVGKAQAWPLTIQLDALDAQAFDLSAQFTFDAGQNPQAGQEWELNQDVPMGDFTVHVNKIVFTGTGYYFEMTAPSEVRSVSLDILNTAPLGGSSGNNGQGLLTASVDYDQPPSGLLTVSISAPILTLRGDWSLQWQPENAPQTESLYGIRLVLDQFIPLDDGYYLIGHTEWTDERILRANVTLGAHDASGGELALDPLYDQEITLPENGWAFKIYGKAFDGDVRLIARDVYIEYSQPALLTIDLRPYNFSFDDANLGVPYKTGLIPIDIPGLSAQLAKATYIKQGDLHGFELAFDTDVRLNGISLIISDGLDTTGVDGVSSGGSSNRDPQSGFVISQATTNARMFFPMTFRIYGATLQGNWSVNWTPPPPEAGATPFYIPQAAVINAQRAGDWTIYSAQDWLQNGETVTISGIVGDADGNLWFGTTGGPVSVGTGLYRFDGETWTRYSMDNGLPADEVSSLAVNPNGELWLTTFCCGAAQFDGDTWKIFTRQDGLPEDDARASLIDRQGNLWLGFSEKGVARFDGETWQTFPLEGYVGHLGLLADGSVLVSLSDNSNPRLIRFDGQQWTDFETPLQMQNAYVFDFVETPDGVLWFASEHDGVFRLSDGEWAHFTQQDGLSSASVLALAVAPSGDIWFGTANGITRFDGENWQTYQPGLWVTSAFVAADGSLWFGADGAILRYEKSE